MLTPWTAPVYAVASSCAICAWRRQSQHPPRAWGGCGASALASLENCIDETVEYARARAVFGKPLLANQAVHFRLAELKTELEALRALTYRAVELYVAGHDALELASMVKLKAGRLSREVADGCLQYWGGMGFMSETNVSQSTKLFAPSLR